VLPRTRLQLKATTLRRRCWSRRFRQHQLDRGRREVSCVLERKLSGSASAFGQITALVGLRLPITVSFVIAPSIGERPLLAVPKRLQSVLRRPSLLNLRILLYRLYLTYYKSDTQYGCYANGSRKLQVRSSQLLTPRQSGHMLTAHQEGPPSWSWFRHPPYC
jgi:hypothetical protein